MGAKNKKSTVLVIFALLCVAVFVVVAVQNKSGSLSVHEKTTASGGLNVNQTDKSESNFASEEDKESILSIIESSISTTYEKISTSSDSRPVATTTKPSTAVTTKMYSDKLTELISGSEETTKRINKIDIPNIFNPPSDSTTATTVKNNVTTASNDFSCFDDCAFLGNSRVLALKNYGLCRNVYAAVGLNVDTVYTKSNRSDGVVIIDELKGQSFRKVYIMFGDNECGWGSLPTFIKHYSKVINTVRSYVPEAEIYLQLILPISKSCSDKNEYGYNKEAIDKLNIMIAQLAVDEGVHCVDPGKAMVGSDGYLPDEASSDGCHLGKSYCIKWLNYLKENG